MRESLPKKSTAGMSAACRPASLVGIAGFFHREGNAPSQWGQQAYLRPSRLSRSAPALASASFRLPRRSSLPVGRQQPWFAWVKLGSVGPPLSSPSHGGPCEGAGNLGLCYRRDSDSFQIDATNLFCYLGWLSRIIPRTPPIRNGSMVDGGNECCDSGPCSVSQTVWTPTR